MRFFKNAIKVTLDNDVVQLAKEFSEKVTPTTNYSDTNQFDRNKIMNDHFTSKLGEEAVKNVFKSLGKSVTGPDYRIYRGRAKSWDDDLYIDGEGLAVKSQNRSLALRFGLSWTFQDAYPRRDIILDKPDAWVCLVEVNDSNNSYECTVYPPYQIKELKFSEPIKISLRGKKKVVYAKDLPVINQ